MRNCIRKCFAFVNLVTRCNSWASFYEKPRTMSSDKLLIALSWGLYFGAKRTMHCAVDRYNHMSVITKRMIHIAHNWWLSLSSRTIKSYFYSLGEWIPFKMRNHAVCSVSSVNCIQTHNLKCLVPDFGATGAQFQSIVYIRLYDDACEREKYKRIKIQCTGVTIVHTKLWLHCSFIYCEISRNDDHSQRILLFSNSLDTSEE